MRFTTLPAVLLAASSAVSAQSPLPSLRTEPTGGGSIFFIRNTSAQPLTAYLIELVDYPGSAYSLFQDEVAAPVPPGGEKRIQVANMTVGAVPDYVKLQAALYADGTSGGAPDKVRELIAHRRQTLDITRELISHFEKNPSKAALIADLKQWSASLQPTGKARNAQAPARMLINDTAAQLETRSREDVLAGLRASEQAMSATVQSAP